MKLTLRELRQRADDINAMGHVAEAARRYLAVLERVPEDLSSRLALADAMASMGAVEAAATIYAATAALAIDGGHPLIAITACRALESSMPQGRGVSESLLARLATVYAKDSERIADVGARLNAHALDEIVVDGPSLALVATGDLITRAAAVGGVVPDTISLPLKLPRDPFLSRLSAAALLRTIRASTVKRLPAGHVLIREGDSGKTCYLLGAGRVEVVKQDDYGQRRQVAQLGAGSVVGEMALITGAPRSATVRTLEPTDVLEVGPDSLAAMGDELDALAPKLHGLARTRWMNNVLEQSALFSMFDAEQRRALLRHFQVHRVPPKTVLFRRGEASRGIFVVYKGEVDVISPASSSGPPPAPTRMRAGAMLGVASLMRAEPSKASAVSATEATLLFLPGSRVRKLRAAVPEFAATVGAIAAQRSGLINLETFGTVS